MPPPIALPPLETILPSLACLGAASILCLLLLVFLLFLSLRELQALRRDFLLASRDIFEELIRARAEVMARAPMPPPPDPDAFRWQKEEETAEQWLERMRRTQERKSR
jgi:predicted Holliday junction resolvase-like endonuclease